MRACAEGVTMRARIGCVYIYIWGFPKIRGYLLKVPIIRIIVFWVYIGVPLFRETTI